MPPNKTDRKKLSVQKLFIDYTSKEELSGDNAYSCDKCGKKQKATKWVEILSPPAHLFLCLNRFSWDLSTGQRNKEKTPVPIDKTVTVCGFVYDLYAAIIHSVCVCVWGGRHTRTRAQTHRDSDTERERGACGS